MFKKVSLLCVAALFCANASATIYKDTFMPTFDVTKSFELAAGDIYEMHVPSLVTSADAKCTLHFEGSSTLPVQVKVKEGSGKINGLPVSSGYSTVLQIKNGQVINIFVKSGSDAEIMNLGETTLIGDCAVDVKW